MAGEIRIPVLRKLAYLSVILTILLVVCEGGLRVRAWMQHGSWTSVRDPMLRHDSEADLFVPIPGYHVKGAQIEITINSLGFRGEEFSKVKPPNTFRIVCLGASTTFSYEVSSDSATWTHLLQERLRAAYPTVRIEVINAAVGGYVASDNLKNLQHRVLPLDPDLVIYYEANNEIVKDTQALAVRQGLLGPDGRRQSPLVSTLTKYILTFDLVYKNLRIIAARQNGGAAKIDRIPRELPDRFIGVLDQMRSVLSAKQIPMVLSTFIVKYRRDQERPTQLANADVEFYYMPWLSMDGMLDAMDVYNDAILEFGKRSGIPVVDERNVIPPDASHFADCMHLTDEGNVVMADRFFRFLKGLGSSVGLPGVPAAGGQGE